MRKGTTSDQYEMLTQCNLTSFSNGTCKAPIINSVNVYISFSCSICLFV